VYYSRPTCLSAYLQDGQALGGRLGLPAGAVGAGCWAVARTSLLPLEDEAEADVKPQIWSKKTHLVFKTVTK
jgi:hypothetical protein